MTDFGDPPPVGLVRCDHPGCASTHPDHAWGHIKASEWFHGLDGAVWCPEHLPAWVGPWRERRAAAREKKTP